jgi:hypothetical protein
MQLAALCQSSASVSAKLQQMALTVHDAATGERLQGVAALCSIGTPVAVLSHLSSSWPSARDAVSQVVLLEGHLHTKKRYCDHHTKILCHSHSLSLSLSLSLDVFSC